MQGPHRATSRTILALVCALGLALAVVDRASASPYDYLPVGDPLETELRILDLLDSRGLHGRLRLPHLHTRPVQLIELQGIGAPPETVDVVRGISIARIERALDRDRGPMFTPHPRYRATPRVLDFGADQEVLQLSAGVEGVGLLDDHSTLLVSGSGFHGRVSMALDRMVAYAHYIVGRIDNARAFADPIVPHNDLIVLPEETYLSYTSERGQWGAQFGRNRWHFGPGEEGSMVLSKTSPVLTGLAFRVHIQSLRADAIALSATVSEARGEQLAVHRVEWQPLDELRIGVTEAARYKGTGWRPLYLMGAIPYVIVQRLERQTDTDSLLALRNNVLTAFDAAWRIADGTRLYGEILIDDIAAKSAALPNKLGYMVGWEGVGALVGTRLYWGGEFTRITRYVYTSFFGRDYVVDDRSLGYPIAPDMRRLKLRTLLDLNPDWQIGVRATHTDKGENDLDEPFLPHSPRVDSFEFEGIVETRRDLDLTLRWWPASGVNLAVSGGYSWVRNFEHVLGQSEEIPRASVEVHLMR